MAGYVLRLHKAQPGTGWFSSQQITQEMIQKIDDPHSDSDFREITSIPSPFARINLLQNAFVSVSNQAMDDIDQLRGNSKFHQLISHHLDLAEMLFNYDAYNGRSNRFEIIRWHPQSELDELRNSGNQQHVRLADTLELFISQDSQTLHFEMNQPIFLFRFDQVLLGGTSPLTLFFTSAEIVDEIDEKIGNHPVFQRSYQPLYKRGEEFQKYIYKLVYGHPELRSKQISGFVEYLERNLEALKYSGNEELHKTLRNISRQSLETDWAANYKILGSESLPVSISGVVLRKENSNQKLESDFQILTDKIPNEEPIPLALIPDFHRRDFCYTNKRTSWNPETEVPYYHEEPVLQERMLPGSHIIYPHLLVSDLLEPYLIRVPYALDDQKFIYNIEKGDESQGYLLPLKPAFFKYFSIEDLLPGGKVELSAVVLSGGSVQVTLKIPVAKAGEKIPFQRIYDAPAEMSEVQIAPSPEKNRGVIVDTTFTCSIFPFTKFETPQNFEPYRVHHMSRSQTMEQLDFFSDQNGETIPSSIRPRSIRGKKVVAVTNFYILEQAFDGIRVNAGMQNIASGVILPKWYSYSEAGSSIKFAVDFGTTNTHAEYQVDGKQTVALTGESSEVWATSIAHPASTELGRGWTTRHQGEFLPLMMGPSTGRQFPNRTVITEHGRLNPDDSANAALADYSISFEYDKMAPRANERLYTELKWAGGEDASAERTKKYIEQLLFMMRGRAMELDASLRDAQVKWLYPSGMEQHRISHFQEIWHDLFYKYFPDSQAGITPILESVAPFEYFKKKYNHSASARAVVSIDIGGGTTDLSVYHKDELSVLSSFRFAGYALLGKGFYDASGIQGNGIVRRFMEQMERKFETNDLEGRRLKEIHNNLVDRGNAIELINFWFNVEEDSGLLKEGREISFANLLKSDKQLSIIFLIFYAAIIYYLALTLKAKGIGVPRTITFSGNGSRLLKILTRDDDALADYASQIFEYVNDTTESEDTLEVIREDSIPKELTCKGAIMSSRELSNADIRKAKVVYQSENLSAPVLYEDIKTQSDIDSVVLEEVRGFFKCFKALHSTTDYVGTFGIEPVAYLMAEKNFDKDLDTYLRDGISQFLDVEKALENSVVPEPLFFYPLVGVLHNLTNKIVDELS